MQVMQVGFSTMSNIALAPLLLGLDSTATVVALSLESWGLFLVMIGLICCWSCEVRVVHCGYAVLAISGDSGQSVAEHPHPSFVFGHA